MRDKYAQDHTPGFYQTRPICEKSNKLSGQLGMFSFDLYNVFDVNGINDWLNT